MSKLDPGEFVFPLFAAGYTIYMLWQEIDAGLRQSSILYTMAVGIPVLVFCTIVIWRAIRSARSAAPAELTGALTADVLKPDLQPSFMPPLRAVVFLAITVVTLLMFETLGYLISFIGFVLASMVLLGVRSPLMLGAVSISTVAIVHVIFVMTLEMNFPKGILASYL